MVDITLTLSIVILNINGLIHQLKDRDYRSEKKNKTRPKLYDVYKEFTLNVKTQIS